MVVETDVLPDMPTLCRGVAAVLTASGIEARHLSVVRRRRNLQRSVHPSEIITCDIGSGGTLDLLCKYGCRSQETSAWRGVSYEAAVYDTVLRSIPLDNVRFYGLYRDETAGAEWLVMNFLRGCVPVYQTPGPDAMVAAARWIARFHRECQRRIDLEFTCVNGMCAGDFVEVAERCAAMQGSAAPLRPWFASRCRPYREFVEQVLGEGTTVIHGDYYPENCVVHEGRVRVLDWEFAAIAPGEMDLASLVVNWPPEIAEPCEAEYAKTRWPDGPPRTFRQALDMARLNLCFQTLSKRPPCFPEQWPSWLLQSIVNISRRWHGKSP